ncbi:MAG: ABC transporter permease [Thiotrichales bacterium]|nr:ABC transporter permease [Thiotrichales bacterium]MCY4286049.1 ABC transporter permease [Thiotrichales bacterium]MCY4350552.1 ABC transporter permease [Thiotrichales bacterium]
MNAARTASGSGPRWRVRAWFMRSESGRGYALLSPTLVVVVLGLLFPMLILTTMSFWKQEYVDLVRTFTTENYAAFFDKRIYSLILYRSIRISALVTLVTIVLAYPLAYYIAFHVKKNKMMWIVLVTIPFWTSYLLRVFAWKVILGYNGVVNSGLISLGIISEPLEFLLYNPTAVVITLAHAWAAVAILPIYVSLEKIDRSLIEAARDLGESAFMTFVRVTLPLSLPGVIAASLLVFIPTVGDYVTPALVGGTRGIMMGNIIQSMFGKALNWPLGAALSIISMLTVTLAVCVLLGATRWYRKKVG